jgi:hypothetical protein
LLRFSVPAPAPPRPSTGAASGTSAASAVEGRLVAAYVVVTRVDLESPLSEGDASTLLLRARRIVDPWEENAVTWATQPRTFDVGLPPVRVSAGAPEGRLRLDVLEIVKRWPRRDPRDQGISLEGEGALALAVALAPLGRDLGRGFGPSAPELELYYAPPPSPAPGRSAVWYP